MFLSVTVHVVSSAYPHRTASGHQSSMSLIRMRKIVGDRMLPYGDPTFMLIGSDKVLPIMIHCDLSDRYELNHFTLL